VPPAISRVTPPAFGSGDDGGLRRQPELEAVTSDRETERSDEPMAVLDDDADDTSLMVRQLTRTARLAALDPDDGIAL